MDKHHVWDEEAPSASGTDAAALAWLEQQIRRPVEHWVLCLLGVPVRIHREPADEQEHGWREHQFPGRALAFLPGKQLGSRTAAGFMDP